MVHLSAKKMEFLWILGIKLYVNVLVIPKIHAIETPICIFGTIAIISTQTEQWIYDPLLSLGTTDDDRTQMWQWVNNPLSRLGTTGADRTQTSQSPYILLRFIPFVFVW